MSQMKEILNARMKALGLKPFDLAKQIAKKRGKDPQAVSSTVLNVLKSPENRRYSNLAEIVDLLDGEIVIRWRTVEEHVLPLSDS